MDSKTKSLFDPQIQKPDVLKQLGRGFEKTFDRPLAHRNDPLSSYFAGDRAVKSGRLKGQIRLVLLGVKRWPGKTSAELAVLLGTDRYDTARRLPTLEHRGLVKKGPARLCRVCKSVCVTWTTPEREKYPLLQQDKKL